MLEGVNDQGPNAMTLHTTSGCTMPEERDMTGCGEHAPSPTLHPLTMFWISFRRSLATNCDWSVNYNAGCGVASQRAESYGPTFNAAGGGIYVLERTTRFIRVFFFSRDEQAPPGVKDGAQHISTSGWVSVTLSITWYSLTRSRAPP